MTATNPIPAGLEADLMAFLPDLKKRCADVQEALYWLRDLQAHAGELREHEAAHTLPEDIRNLIEEVDDLDLDSMECTFNAVEPDYESLGQIGTLIDEMAICEKALNRWARSGGRDPAWAGIFHVDGKRFVEVWSPEGEGTLAIYRVSTYGELRRLPHPSWPEFPRWAEGEIMPGHPQATFSGRDEAGLRIDHDANQRALADTAKRTIAAFRENDRTMTGEVCFISEEEDRNPPGVAR